MAAQVADGCGFDSVLQFLAMVGTGGDTVAKSIVSMWSLCIPAAPSEFTSRAIGARGQPWPAVAGSGSANREMERQGGC